MRFANQDALFAASFHAQRRFFHVVFVLNFADQFFQQIFQRDQSCRPAAFVDNNSQKRAAPAQFFERGRDTLGFGNEIRFAHHLSRQNRARFAARKRGQQIFGRQNSNYAVDCSS
jgi:hypothetical protein